jgi:hypothetical protein
LFSSRVSSSSISAFSIISEASTDAIDYDVSISVIRVKVQRPEDSSVGFVKLSLGSHH